MNGDIPDIIDPQGDNKSTISGGDRTIDSSSDQSLKQSRPNDTINLTPEQLNANDADVIEKEWVSLVQNVVNTTQDSPYTQQKEISKIKAQYLQKRYGKTIRLAEDR